jgi:4-amino-4-deoxy-L-arabinose transferase-like glycosyltransferase
MIPRAVEQLFHPQLKKDWAHAQMDIIHGRYVSLGMTILLGLLIFTWSMKLYGKKTALLVFLTYLLCPNFLAHGIFVSSDIFAYFFLTAALYCLWLFFRQRELKYFLLMCLSTGLAQISKFSMFHLFLLIPLLFGIQILYQKKREHVAGFGLKKITGYLMLFLFINWIVICTSHLFYQVFLPINNYTFTSDAFKQLQKSFSIIFPRFPVPLPSSYIGSMDAVMFFDNLGGGVQGSLNGAPYILGKSSVTGFWYYYFVAIFFKVPVSLLMIWLASIALLMIRFSRKAFFQNEIFLLAPSVYFLVYMSFFYSTQVGIRHILIIFPLLFIFSGKIISLFIDGQKRLYLYLLVGYQAISVLSYFPHFLPYTNEFITNKKLAYRKIADTNICYGEGKRFLQDYLEKNPDITYMPEKPIAGKVILEINEMLNLNISTVHKYDWANTLVPIDHIHSQYLVFEVSSTIADSLKKNLRYE